MRTVIAVVLGVILVGGILLIVGTKLRWRLLVDPPEGGLFGTLAFIQEHLGPAFLIGFNYFLGGGFVALSLFFLIKLLSGRLMVQ